jgi:hypothetical protein
MRADFRRGLALLAVLGLAACDRYVDRRDQVTFGSGDAVAFNKAAQIIDPWPVASRRITHGMRGEQAEAALEKLRKRERGDDGGASQPQTSQLAPAQPGQPK